MMYGIATASYNAYKFHFESVMAEVVAIENRRKSIIYISSNDTASLVRLRGYGRGELTVFVCDTFYSGKFVDRVLDVLDGRDANIVANTCDQH